MTMPGQRILIVDSDAVAALITQRGLQRLLEREADISVAPSPGAAWGRCVRQPVDLVIIDPGPQNQAAVALIKGLRERCPTNRSMVLTAYDTPGLRAQMRELGVKHYLAKPVDLLELAQTVRAALELAPPAEVVQQTPFVEERIALGA